MESGTISVKKAERAILADIKHKYRIFIDMKSELEDEVRGKIKSLDERIVSITKTLDYIDSAWKNIYSDYADRKISKDEYLLQSKEHKQRIQTLTEELEKLKSEKKQKEPDASTDVVELLLQKFSEAKELTNEIKSAMIEKVLVYANNALEIYWKPDFAKYFENTELIVRKEKAANE